MYRIEKKVKNCMLIIWSAIMYFAPHIVTSTTFFAYCYLSKVEDFRASNIYTTLTYCSIMAFYLRMFQGLAWITAEMQNTNRRITEILMLDENADTNTENVSFKEDSTEKILKCEKLTCTYPKVKQSALSGPDFHLLTLFDQLRNNKINTERLHKFLD